MSLSFVNHVVLSVIVDGRRDEEAAEVGGLDRVLEACHFESDVGQGHDVGFDGALDGQSIVFEVAFELL